MKQVMVSQGSRQLARNQLEREAEKITEDACPHNEYCTVRRVIGGSCNFGYKSCQIYKYYLKYPNQEQEQMFIGSKL